MKHPFQQAVQTMAKTETNTRERGDQGEKIARDHLLQKGYRIVATNWHAGHLELDIVAVDQDELVVVEVKTRHGDGFEHPLDALTHKKMRQVIDAAEAYILYSGWEKETRFNLITIVYGEGDHYELEHFEDAFNAEA